MLRGAAMPSVLVLQTSRTPISPAVLHPCSIRQRNQSGDCSWSAQEGRQWHCGRSNRAGETREVARGKFENARTPYIGVLVAVRDRGAVTTALVSLAAVVETS